MKIQRAGDSALLVETGDLETSHRLHATLRDRPLPGIVDIVPGERTVLVVAAGPVHLDQVTIGLQELSLHEDLGERVDSLEISVVYDGADLEEVADLTGFSREEVVRRHSESVYTVAYLGFSPGFGYLTGLDPALHVSRRESPRTAVPAGSLAIAGPYAAVYPSRSPGGWRLLGRTEVPLWDVTRDPPSLLRPGTRVHFVPEEPC